jgi:hypothetical protein
MSLIDFRAARSEIRLAEVLSLLGWRARERRGEQVRGPCPLPGGRCASGPSPTRRTFSAHLGKSVWHCFRCAAAGNALDLWVSVTGQELYPAVLDLYQRLGRAVPWLEPTHLVFNNKDKRESRSMRD